MNKFFKYHNLFYSFLIVVGLLVLPFLPFAKYNGKTNEEVLSAIAPEFSEVLTSKVLESSLSSDLSGSSYTNVLSFSNESREKKDFKVVVTGAEGFFYEPTFEGNKLDIISLNPGEVANVNLNVTRSAEANSFEAIIFILSAL